MGEGSDQVSHAYKIVLYLNLDRPLVEDPVEIIDDFPTDRDELMKLAVAAEDAVNDLIDDWGIDYVSGEVGFTAKKMDQETFDKELRADSMKF